MEDFTLYIDYDLKVLLEVLLVLILLRSNLKILCFKLFAFFYLDKDFRYYALTNLDIQTILSLGTIQFFFFYFSIV